MSKIADIPSCVDCKNKNSIFCSITLDEKEALGNNKLNNFYKKGDVIFREGTASHGLYCIYDGKVKLTKLGHDGKDQVVRFSNTGDILGYRSLLNNEAYQATAIALEDSYICQLSKGNFINSIKENSTLSLEVIQLLSSNLKNAEKHLVNIAQKTAKERIVASILLLQDVFGFKEDGESLDIILTRSEIADIAGTTSETTIRTLKKLSDINLIVLKGKSISIPDLQALSAVTGF